MNLAPQIHLHGTLSYLDDGYRGTMQTIGTMRALVNAYRVDPVIRQAAVSVLFLTPEREGLSRPIELFEWVRSHVRYVPDVLDVETITTPDKTLQTLAGDCDDQALLLATLYESVGYPTRFVVTGYTFADQFEHVFVQVCVDGEWFDVDPTEREGFGNAAPGETVRYTEGV